MENNIKIGLSRSRLFDFQCVVNFVGEVQEPFNLKELSKALKMLSVKEPLITSVIYLDDSSEAYLQTEKVEPKIEVIENDVDLFLQQQISNGIDLEDALFKFFVINKNTLAIFSHTVVSDSKSLLILAKELLSFYTKESVDALPKSINLFSEESDLPIEVSSFVADRVTEVLDNNYLLKPQKFTYVDYKKAKCKFDQGNSVAAASYTFDNELCEKLNKRCSEIKIDFSSMVLFALTEVIKANKKVKKTALKVNVQVDRRPFFIDKASYSVGCFNGSVSLDLAEKKGDLQEKVKAFHNNLYKKACGCFNAFYNEVFLSKLTPAFLDSCFMYKAGVYKNRHTKKLATLYGCEQQFLCSFEAINLNQNFWEKLSTFHHIRVKEPHKSNFEVSFSLVMGSENELFVEWDSAEYSEPQIEDFIEKSISLLKQI